MSVRGNCAAIATSEEKIELYFIWKTCVSSVSAANPHQQQQLKNEIEVVLFCKFFVKFDFVRAVIPH